MSIRVMSFAPPQALQAQESPDTLDDEADAATDEPPDGETSSPAPSGSALAVVPGGIATGPHRLTTMNRWAGHRDAVPAEPSDEPIGWRARGPRSAVPATTTPSPAGTTAPPPAAAPAQPRRDTGERPTTTTAYVGERPVDADWLDQRESALKALRADYEAARAAAQATPGSGPGWIEDRGGNPLRDLPASDNRPRVEAPDGRTMVFSEEAFAAQFKAQLSAQPSAALKALATCYETDAATLLTRQPGLWTLAMTDHAPNAGPPPPGRAMGDADQLGKLDLYLADPQIAALIAAYGGTAAPAKGAVAQEQVRLFGAERFAQLSRLNNAMAAVRSHYSAALARAEQSGSGPGWREQQTTVTEHSEFGGADTTYQVTTRTFDPDAFTDWYIAQDSLANETFAAFYGRSHTSWESDDMGRSGGEGGSFDPLAAAPAPVASMTFDNAQWTLRGVGGAMSHTALRQLNINDTPRLHDRNAVGFDLEAGWVTHPSNIRESRDLFETVVQVFIVGVVSYASFTALGPAAASAMGLTTTGAAGTTVLTAGGVVVASAVAGATTTAVSGAMNGNFAWRDVLRGALAGGLSAGLMNTFGPAVQGAAGAAGTIALRTTVQGGIQALLGGKFSDGALAGFASGLADLAAANMESGIEAAVEGGKMTAAEAFAARSFARVVGSAIRALGDPNNPGYAFASAFVNSLMPAQDTLTPGVTAGAAPALDDDGNLMPGVVDSAASLEQQQAQLQARLIGQGIDGAQASSMASAHYAAPILIRNETVREALQVQQTDDARAAIDAFEPGSASELLADAGGTGSSSDAGNETPRWRRLGESLQRLVEADTPFLIERNQAFLKAQIGKYEQLEAQALGNGDTVLARNLSSERALIENTLTRLDARLVEVDYGAAALRYADRLALNPGNTFSRQEILQATQRFVAGTPITGNAVDDYVRTQMASDDTRLYLTVLGGGSIAALVGQDGSGAGSPRLQRTPNGSVQVPGTNYRYNFDNLGRVENARADMTLGEGTRNGDLQRNAGGSDRRMSDDGGHIVGNRFNPPTEEFNLFAQDANFNRGAYRTLEGQWASALAEGQTVKVEWKFYYSGGSVRPDRLDVTYRVGNNTTVTERFRNAPGGGR